MTMNAFGHTKPEERQFSPTQGRHPRVQPPGFGWKGETNSIKQCAEERDYQ